MASVQEYYIVPKNVYDYCTKPDESLDDQLQKLPYSSKINAYDLINSIKKLISWDPNTGLISGSDKSIFPYLNYSVRGKNKPKDWEEFLPNLWTVPQYLLCERVKRDVKSLARKNGRKLYKKGVD